jgi:membrane-associated phospholipid phosphatase
MAFKILLVRSALALMACALLVTLCYFFVDRPVASFVHDQGFNRFEVLKWLTYIPDYLDHTASVVLVLGAVRLVWGPFSRLERMLFAAAVSLAVALVFKNSLKVVFGRYWPETWVDNNPSWIRNEAYGFHLFQSGSAYESFPSGHTTRIFAVMMVVWIAFPRWRWLCVLSCGAVIVGLLGMNYHFVGDVVGGAFVGSITAMYVAHFFPLDAAGEIHQTSERAIP